jgi:hypothetical protein
MSRQDLLARVRLLDPLPRLGEEPADQGVVFERVLARSRSSQAARRLSVRVGLIASAAVAVVLVLPALAVGTSPLHRLLSQPAAEATPVNGLLAVKGADGLYVVDPQTGGMLALQGTSELDQPTWSPDARFLAVEKAEKGGGTSVYTIWPNGTHPQLIMSDASSPAWSDDGTRVFVQRDTCTAPGGCDSSDDDTTVVYSVAADGSDAHPIGDDDYNVSQPGWPPGQNILSFLDSSNGPTAAPTEVDSSAATWSPDGTELAFVDAATGLWEANADGQLRLLVKGTFSSPSWGVERADQSREARSTGARSARR